jgi:hypothetical protein
MPDKEDDSAKKPGGAHGGQGSDTKDNTDDSKKPEPPKR